MSNAPAHNTRRKPPAHPNEVHAQGAAIALRNYIKADPHAEKKQHVNSLLADLRHYCDMHGIDYAERDRIAYADYLAELNGE